VVDEGRHFISRAGARSEAWRRGLLRTLLAFGACAVASARTAAAADTQEIDALQDVAARFERLAQKASNRSDAQVDPQELRSMRGRVDDVDKDAQRDFDEIEKQIRDKQLPAAILDRHREAVRAHHVAVAALRERLHEVGRAGGEPLVADVRVGGRSGGGFDPSTLPFRTPDGRYRRGRTAASVELSTVESDARAAVSADALNVMAPPSPED
jgi:hypothetical protein